MQLRRPLQLHLFQSQNKMEEKEMKKKLAAAVLMMSATIAMTACGTGNDAQNTVESSESEAAADSGEESADTQEAGTEYIFEAEYTVLEGLEGLGVSGSPTGVGLAKEKASASNGFYVGELGTSSPITFVITSDVDATATLKGVFGSNVLGNCTWNPASFIVTVNGEAIQYEEFTTDNGTDANDQENFKTKNLGEIQLKAGENQIVFTAGDNTYRGNLPSAPSIDCLKITTEASLSMEEVVENIE